MAVSPKLLNAVAEVFAMPAAQELLVEANVQGPTELALALVVMAHRMLRNTHEPALHPQVLAAFTKYCMEVNDRALRIATAECYWSDIEIRLV
jgi:hypothetical protein